LQEISQGDFSHLTQQAVERLNFLREEGTYIRSAYHLFTQGHAYPERFHKFVKHFGKLKDAIKHDVPEILMTEAKWLTEFLQNKNELFFDESIAAAEDDDFYAFIRDEIESIRELNSKEILSIDEFHHIKKASRELGFLFRCLSEDAYNLGQYHFIYEA